MAVKVLENYKKEYEKRLGQLTLKNIAVAKGIVEGVTVPGGKRREYRVLNKKGEGTFSEVLKCQNIKDGTYVACKKMKQHYDSIEQVNNLREIQAMRRLTPHPNILELHEVLFDKKSGTLVLICELMDMNIYELIKDRTHYLSERKVKSYMFQLLKSIYHMHRNGIFHRDVKPENILVKDDVLKLADYGSCRSIYSKQPYTEYISTRWYRAPECLLTDGYYGFKMDIWSVGCVFFEILSLHPLFPGSNEVDQIAKIHDIMGTPDASVLSKLRNKNRGMNFNFPTKKGSGIEKLLPNVPQDCIELIYQMCKYDPEERITAKQALRHPYFKEHRDAEKKALQIARAEQQRLQEQQEQAPSPKLSSRLETSRQPDTNHESSPIVEKENMSPSNMSTFRSEADSMSEKKTPRPGSGAKYGANILNGSYYQRREKRKRKKRSTESGPDLSTNNFLPKVAPNPKPSTFQPTFTSSYNNFGISNTYTSTSLPKLGTSNITTKTYLPALSQNVVNQKPKPRRGRYDFGQFNVHQYSNNRGPAKNVYGHYQLPPVDRRGAGF